MLARLGEEGGAAAPAAAGDRVLIDRCPLRFPSRPRLTVRGGTLLAAAGGGGGQVTSGQERRVMSREEGGGGGVCHSPSKLDIFRTISMIVYAIASWQIVILCIVLLY